MEKFKQYRFLKKVEKLLNKPAPPDELYDTTADTMYVGATAPRTAGHFADSAVAVRQGQVKAIVEMVGEVIAAVAAGVNEGIEERLAELEVRFQELDLGLLFTEQEQGERRGKAMAARRRRKRAVKADGTESVRREVSSTELEGMSTQIAQWQKEQLERKRRLYKIETMVRDLGVNINDVRCRALERDRRVALANLKGSTDAGVRMLREVVGRLEEVAVGSGSDG